MNRPLLIGLTLASLAFIILLGAITYFFFLLHRRRQNKNTDIERGNTTSSKVADVSGKENFASVARKFSWQEIDSITNSFASTKMIGEGGYSSVYLAKLANGLAAVKVYRSASERLNRAFRQELELLLRLQHCNLVRLLGFCDEREEGVLVLEYIPGGNLHDKLHSSSSGSEVLPWSRRTAIAYHLAQALEYLHEYCDPAVVHGDMKAANVLLESNLNAKLCDFGSATVGFSAMVQPQSRSRYRPIMTGSLGYIDPHYMRTGVMSKKSDVYSFGVLLLELVTGEEAFCTEKQLPLVSVTLAAAIDEEETRQKGVAELVDAKLAGKFDAGEAAEMVLLAKRCVGEQPSLRPAMAEVVRIIAEKVPSAMQFVGATESKKN